MLEFHFLDVEAFCTLGADFILHVDVFERKISEKHAKNQNSHSPHIQFVYVYFFVEYLRGHVGCSAAKCIDILIILSAESQITNFDAISKMCGFR